MKIAIIGASGFVGYNILNEIKKNKKFTIIATYNKKKINNKNKNIIFKKLDFQKKKINIFKYLEEPDIVINSSWRGIPNYESEENFKTLKYQKILCKNLIQNGLKHLMVLGTCFEYNYKNGLLSERTKMKPLTKYGLAKVQLLEYLKEIKKKYNFKLSWLRLFYMYGHNPNRDTLYSLLKKFENNKISKLSISGDLERDYLHIKEIAKYIERLVLKNMDLGVINICSGKPISLKKLSKQIINKKKFEKLNFVKYQKNSYEPKKFWGCNKKLNKVLK